MELDRDPSYYKDKPKSEEKHWSKRGSYGWHLRDPDGVLLARAIKPQALFNTAKAMFDLGHIKNSQDKLYSLYLKNGALCATVSTKAGYALSAKLRITGNTPVPKA